MPVEYPLTPLEPFPAVRRQKKKGVGTYLRPLEHHLTRSNAWYSARLGRLHLSCLFLPHPKSRKPGESGDEQWQRGRDRDRGNRICRPTFAKLILRDITGINTFKGGSAKHFIAAIVKETARSRARRVDGSRRGG